MLAHVFLHPFANVGRKIASVLVTLEEPIPSVPSHVHSQFPLSGETRIALFTHEWPHVLVNGFIVPFKITGVLVAVVAERALEGTIVRVDGHVLLERHFGAKFLRADFALVGAFLKMNVRDVIPEGGFMTESLTARGAQFREDAFVNLFDVSFQGILAGIGRSTLFARV